VRHAAKERESLDEPLENGLGAFGGQGQREWAVGVTPGGNQDRDLSTEFREVDVNVSEVGFESMTGRVFERDEGLAAFEAIALDVASDLIIASRVVVFTNEPPKDLLSGVSLLGRCRPVLGEDLIDDGSEVAKHRSKAWLRQRVWLGLSLAQNLGDRSVGVPKLFGELADGKAISPNAARRRFPRNVFRDVITSTW
jgi:hypothetical protein